jgi:hypothetical protein
MSGGMLFFRFNTLTSHGEFCLFCAPHGNEKVIECPTLMQSTIHVYEVRPRKDKRGVDLICDALPFGTTDNVAGRYRSVSKSDSAKPTHAGGS